MPPAAAGRQDPRPVETLLETSTSLFAGRSPWPGAQEQHVTLRYVTVSCSSNTGLAGSKVGRPMAPPTNLLHASLVTLVDLSPLPPHASPHWHASLVRVPLPTMASAPGWHAFRPTCLAGAHPLGRCVPLQAGQALNHRMSSVTGH
jgi:hypothetical protein